MFDWDADQGHASRRAPSFILRNQKHSASPPTADTAPGNKTKPPTIHPHSRRQQRIQETLIWSTKSLKDDSPTIEPPSPTSIHRWPRSTRGWDAYSIRIRRSTRTWDHPRRKPAIIDGYKPPYPGDKKPAKEPLKKLSHPGIEKVDRPPYNRCDAEADNATYILSSENKQRPDQRRLEKPHRRPEAQAPIGLFSFRSLCL